MNNPDAVIGKLVIRGKLVAKKPLIIGSGNDDLADIEVLRDELGKPFIPATSFVGVLRHYIEEESCQANPDQSRYFWGSNINGGSQSALCCHDLRTDNARVKIRDGVAINPKTGVAIDEKKYDYEVVEPSASFDMYLEITIRQAFDKEVFKRILATIIDLLKKGKVRFGAKTTSGFGHCKLDNVKYYEFDFSKKDEVWQWLKQDFSQESRLDANPLLIKQKTFTIDAVFSIKSSLIVRSYSSDTQSPDMVHIKSNDENVLPGTSTKGAIRTRGLKILKTLGCTDAKEKIDGLFGFVDEENKKKSKSRLIVEETEIKNAAAELQHRIKIDRFTGGTIKTALFESMPLWGKGNDESVEIKMTINDYQDWEAGLLLLILKDLWNNDLAIGGEKNVGRGILNGVRAKIQWDEKEIMLEEIILEGKDDRFLNISPKEDAVELERFCHSLQKLQEEFKEDVKSVPAKSLLKLTGIASVGGDALVDTEKVWENE